ncbi:hypothetical protein [Streptococcus halichoeri]|uniref:hypothetical protein n=1 Tax=Streptococcus halichoeri TaxID=254785 RepID=UPI00135CA8AF|nr:hypothetical protein [Streptococcus halichoeri]
MKKETAKKTLCRQVLTSSLLAASLFGAASVGTTAHAAPVYAPEDKNYETIMKERDENKRKLDASNKQLEKREKQKADLKAKVNKLREVKKELKIKL